MSTACNNMDVATSRGTMSAAAFRPEQSETSALLRSTYADAHATAIERSTCTYEDDEESQYGFWGESAPFYDSETHSFWSKSPIQGKLKPRSLHDIICFWSATLMCILTAVLLCWALVSNSRYDIGVLLAKWSAGDSVSSANVQHELRFCLSMPNREAPGAQTWRYLAPSVPFDCTTEIITLSADSSDYWKVHTSDDILLGESHRPSIRIEEGARFIGVEAKIRALETGDDLAVEGDARS